MKGTTRNTSLLDFLRVRTENAPPATRFQAMDNDGSSTAQVSRKIEASLSQLIESKIAILIAKNKEDRRSFMEANRNDPMIQIAHWRPKRPVDEPPWMQ